MATENLSNFLRRLTCGMAAEALAEHSDQQLVERALAECGEAPLQAIVHRHGPMVYRVCWRVLLHQQDTEDAFQATFLILAQKLRTLRKSASLASWLHGVAHRVALKAKAQSATRRRLEHRASPTEVLPTDDVTWGEFRSALDSELNQLPDKWRLPLILCYLEGRTQEESASHLGWSKSTLRRRLEEARTALGGLLTRRGIAWSAAISAVLFSDCIATAAPAPGLIASTVEAAAGVAAGKTVAKAAPATVAALTQGVLKTMLMSKLKAIVAVVLMLGLMGTGTTFLTSHVASAQGGQQPAAEVPVKEQAKQKPEPEKEAFTAWGKEVSGLQAGLGYLPGKKRAYSHGETVKLVVRVRNIGKNVVKFEYLKQFFMEIPPAVTDDKGKPVPLGRVDVLGGLIHLPVEVILAPGTEIELYEWQPGLRQASEFDLQRPEFSALYGAGKFQIQYEHVFGNSSAAAIKLDPALSKLATGKLELEIMPKRPGGQPPALEGQPKAPPKQEKGDDAAKQKEKGETEKILEEVRIKGKKQPEKAKKEQNVLTPEEAIKQRSKEKVTVQFKVASVEVTPLRGLKIEGYNEGPLIRLKDGNKFSVLLRGPASYQIMRLGIEPDKHFSGKVVRVTGLVQPDLPAAVGPPFNIWVDDLTHFEVVKE